MCVLVQDFSRCLTSFGAPASLIEQALLMALDELELGVGKSQDARRRMAGPRLGRQPAWDRNVS